MSNEKRILSPSLTARSPILTRLSSAYDVNQWELPLPIWASRGFEHNGKKAWRVLQRALNEGAPARPMCIYLHIPFCTSKCGFCDSYSFRVGRYAEDHIEMYVSQLCQELNLWSQQGNLSQRPVPTVHLGGGTPCFIGEAALAHLVECIRTNFNVLPDTEWALETTIESMTPAMIATLHQLGFRRVHFGVQTLEQEARLTIGRRCPPGLVLQRIAETLGRGWVASVDLLCGLPFQTLDGFIGGIETLVDTGVDGFSLYELLIYPQNRRWAEKFELVERDHLPNFLMFTAGAEFLEEKGFSKNLFNHWADERDRNIYFTHPIRNEDLLAVGTIADGVIGDYHYRHPRYARYRQEAKADFPGLEGGLRRTRLESQIQPLITALLSATVHAAVAADIRAATISNLLDRWERHGLVVASAEGSYQLTPSGSWFAGNMICELVFHSNTRI